MTKRIKSKPGVSGPSDVAESFASLVRGKHDGAASEDGESFASLVKGTKDAGASKPAKKRAKTSAGATTRKRAQTQSKAKRRAKSKSEASEKAPPAASPLKAKLEPPERYNTTVAVFENGASNQKRAVDVIAALGYTAEDTRRDAGKLRRALTDKKPPQMVVVGLPGGEPIIEEVREIDPELLVIATVPGPAESARQRAEQVGADLFVIRPHTKDSLAVVLLAAEELARSRKEASELRKAEAALRASVQQLGGADSTTGFQHFEFFERILIMEIKRAKRFGYSLATALLAFDEPAGGEYPAPVRAALRERVASAIRANIRSDIDLPVDYAEGRILLFLPYTDLDGATEVGRRVAAAVKQFGHIEVDRERVSCSVSIGISSIRPGNPISFARLMKDAKQALRAAKLKGGGQIVVRR